MNEAVARSISVGETSNRHIVFIFFHRQRNQCVVVRIDLTTHKHQ
jgi:hypothetical protein